MAKQIDLTFVTGQKFNNDGTVKNVYAVELDLELVQCLLALQDVTGILSDHDSEVLKNTTVFKTNNIGRIPTPNEIRRSMLDQVLLYAAKTVVDSTIGARDSFEETFDRNVLELSQYNELSREEVRTIAHRNALVSLVGNWVVNMALTGKVRS